MDHRLPRKRSSHTECPLHSGPTPYMPIFIVIVIKSEYDYIYTCLQVGNGKVDHSCWNRPEDMTEARPVTMVNASSPGTDVAAETAAALASASLVFKSSDATYSSVLLKHAQQLFAFGDQYRKAYSISVPEVGAYYNSTGYGDELLWAAAWLYHATGDQAYLDYLTGDDADKFGNWGSPTWFSWDNKLPGAQVHLLEICVKLNYICWIV